ncbi:unnamed protein product [Prunus armeniaca]
MISPKTQERGTLNTLYFFDMVFIQAIPKAHQNQQAKCGVLQMLDHSDAYCKSHPLRMLRTHLQTPPGEVVAEEVPHGAVDGRVMLCWLLIML